MNDFRITSVLLPISQERPKVVRVNSTAALTSFLESIDELQTEPPSLYVDGEWSRGEAVEFLHIFVAPRNVLYRIPLHGKRDLYLWFETVTGASLMSILQSRSIPKVFFNAQGLLYVLWKWHAVFLSGIHDLQLMELASRHQKFLKEDVASFSECVEGETIRIGEITGRLPDKKGYYIEDRISPTLPSVVIRRLELFPALWEIYHTRLCYPGRAFWMEQVQLQTAERVADTRRPDFDPGVDDLALGPVEWTDHELRKELVWDWNMRLMQKLYVEE